MAAQPHHLPRRFPAGTKYVIEGRGGRDGRLRVSSRYIQFPDGRHLQLPVAQARTPVSGRFGSRGEKNLNGAGTAPAVES